MRDLLPGFYKRTEEELSILWQEGIFVFDTNMLLNVYRYTQNTRDRYFEILDLLKKREQIWIPYQVAYEYQDRRMDVIQGQLDAYTDVSTILQTTWQKLENALEPYKSKHGFIDATKLAEDITDVIKKAKTTVTKGKEKEKREYEALKKNDKHLDRLEELFQGNIGSPYDRSKLEELYRQAQLRVELKIPPGWEDENKKGYRMYGEVILWFQLLDFARSKKKPIIFVTDDGKKDWWFPEAKSQERDRPLPELVQEMFVEAGVLFHMYQGYAFLKQAEHFLQLEEKPEIIADAKAVTNQNTALFYQVIGRLGRQGYQVENAVLEWLRNQYPESQLSEDVPRGSYDPGVDFSITEKDGTKIGFEVKYLASPFVLSDGRRVLEFLTTGRRYQRFDKLVAVLVSLSQDDAIMLTRKLQEGVVIPPNISILIGYLDLDGKFTLVSKLP